MSVSITKGWLRLLRTVGVAAFALAGAGSDLAAQQTGRAPSAQSGRDLAIKLCQSCHLIEEKSDAVVPVGPPPFSVIANRPEQTAERIRFVLFAPHPPMPEIQLTNEEIDDIIAYLDQLRSDQVGPRLLPPRGEEKLQTPSPS
jgi:cytochrome c2